MIVRAAEPEDHCEIDEMIDKAFKPCTIEHAHIVNGTIVAPLTTDSNY